VYITRWWIDSVTALGIEITHFSLQQANVVCTRSSIEIVETRTAPEHVVVPLSAIQFIALRRSEQPVVTRTTKQSVEPASPHQGIITRTATDGVIPRISMHYIVTAAGTDDIVLIGTENQIRSVGANAGGRLSVT
jgi:hypothetical protein